MTVKFISLNLWWGGNLLPGIIDFLRNEDADIVALQEVHNGRGPGLKDRQRSMEVLQEKLGYPHRQFAESHVLSTQEGKIPSGNAVLSKFPITRHSITFLFDSTQPEYLDIPEQWPIFPRILQRVELYAPTGEINVFNMHGVWDLDGDKPSAARRTMVDRIMAAIKDKPNVILAGDTNAKTSNPILGDIERRLTSVFKSELPTTFNMRRKDNPGYAMAAVDHIYISPNIKIISYTCPSVDISDHLPLIATLEIS